MYFLCAVSACFRSVAHDETLHSLFSLTCASYSALFFAFSNILVGKVSEKVWTAMSDLTQSAVEVRLHIS